MCCDSLAKDEAALFTASILGPSVPNTELYFMFGVDGGGEVGLEFGL